MSKIQSVDRDYVWLRLNRKEVTLLISMLNREIPRRKSIASKLFNKFQRPGQSTKNVQQVKDLSSTLHEASLRMDGK